MNAIILISPLNQGLPSHQRVRYVVKLRSAPALLQALNEKETRLAVLHQTLATIDRQREMADIDVPHLYRELEQHTESTEHQDQARKILIPLLPKDHPWIRQLS